MRAPYLAVCLLAAACSDDRVPGDPGGDGAGGDADLSGDHAGDSTLPADQDSRPHFAVCTQSPLPTGLPTEAWQNAIATPLIVIGEPGHSAQDVIALAGSATTLPGKFAYGLVSKDLEGEYVEVYLDDCAGTYRLLGRAPTDTDGRIALPLADVTMPAVGTYALYFRVVGDNTFTQSTLTVLVPGTRLAVFDIDGTLTTDDWELMQDIFVDLFDPIFAGDYVPTARAGAVATTQERGIRQGYVVVYLTGRPYVLTQRTRDWLRDVGAAPGSLHVTDSNAEAMPDEGGVGAYKAAYLARLQLLQLTLSVAYGNATTDISAYAQAGIPVAQTFIVGDHGGEQGTVDLGDDYLTHLAALDNEPAVVQPFVR